MLKLFILGNKVKIILYCVIRDPLYDKWNIEETNLRIIDLDVMLLKNGHIYVSNIS